MSSSRAKLFFLLALNMVWAACTQPTEKEVIAESEKANAFFERVFDEAVDRSPETQTMLGIKKDYGKWNDLSEAFAVKELEITKRELKALQDSIDYTRLDAATKLSYDLFVAQSEQEIQLFKYRFHNYPVNQMFGRHSTVPSLLINMHRITDSSDAEAYISRLQKVNTLFSQLIDGLKKREEKGIIPPKFVYPHVIRDCQNLISGTTLINDFKGKLDALSDLDKDRRNDLVLQAESAIQDSLAPAYEGLVVYLKELEQKATDDDGVWKFPDGENYYNARLRQITTTDLTAEQIHQIGLDEVKRIHAEMTAIKEKVGFEGSLQDFFVFMRNDDQFYYQNTEADREKYMAEATAIIDNMKSHLDELFLVKPKADMIVKRVEKFREESAGIAFYQRPAPDGSRPGTYYANMHEMKDMPIYQMESLAYHEGIPGHHMQIAIAQELENVPKFRKFGGYTAYVEGWGLYSEFIPKEMGLYQDPYSDFGRLAAELWRACRLVVDTGIHYKKWTRQQGIDYYMANTPNSEGDAVKMVERHIVMAGQATAYKIGMLKILELRERAKRKLGAAFDIRQFHQVVLTNGAVPLNVLERMVDEWIASAQS